MKNRTSLTIIFFTVFIDLLGFGLLIPILPTFASKELSINDFDIGIIVGVYSLMQFIFNPVLGNYSDRFGRRPIILISLLLNAASYVIFSFAHSMFLLMVSRIIAGFGGSNISTAQAYIADITDSKNRSKGMGMIGAAFGLGFVFGPMMGGILSSYSYALVGYTAAGFSFLAFLFALIYLKESHLNRNSERKKSNPIFSPDSIKEILVEKKLAFFILIYFIIIFSQANIYGTFALLGFKVYDFTNRQIGYLFGVIGIVGAIIQGGLIRQLSKRINSDKLVFIGLFFMMIGLTGMPYGINFTGVAIVGGFLAIGTGILQPTILGLISNETPDEKQGKILGFNSSFGALARVLGPLWGGFAYDYLGYQFPFLTGGIFTLFTLFISFYFLNSKKYSYQKENV